jgi:hypothetical protein
MTDDEKMPAVIMLPEAQAQIDADPKLKAAMPGFYESMKNAMQGVVDGRYKTFEDAFEAMTGNRPELVEPPNPPRHGYYLSMNRNPKGDGILAVITDGHPRMGHTPVEIMDMDVFKDEAAAKEWFEIRCHVLPYEDRHTALISETPDCDDDDQTVTLPKTDDGEA